MHHQVKTCIYGHVEDQLFDVYDDIQSATHVDNEDKGFAYLLRVFDPWYYVQAIFHSH
jgi:hypothetical protein